MGWLVSGSETTEALERQSQWMEGKRRGKGQGRHVGIERGGGTRENGERVGQRDGKGIERETEAEGGVFEADLSLPILGNPWQHASMDRWRGREIYGRTYN